jgi:LuxR family maltose regulon positive regulatory protein
MFLDEGSSMMQLLREASAHKMMPDYTNRLLAALERPRTQCRGFEAEQKASPDKSPLPDTAAVTLGSSPAGQILVEPLTQRELEILRLFKTELSGPEIAQELVISLSTVRTHTKRIYSKLSVNTRRAAVKRAEELDLM